MIDEPVDTAKVAYDAALQSAKAAAAAAATTSTPVMTSSAKAVTLPAVVSLPNTMIKTASAFGQNEPSASTSASTTSSSTSTSHASGSTTQKIASSANQATSTAPIPQHTATTTTA